MEEHNSGQCIDIQNIGELCALIRESRGIRPASMVNYITNTKGVRLYQGSISNFEQKNIIGPPVFQLYLEALQTLTDLPLRKNQMDLLQELYSDRSAVRQRKLRCRIADYDFRHWLPEHQSKEMVDLLKELTTMNRPAVVIDDLYFDHVINGAMLHLFSVEPEYLYRWEAWHSVATKFHIDSPVRKALPHTNQYFGETLAEFFEDWRVYRLLFTPQMRTLIQEMCLLSREQQSHFHKWWKSVMTFSVPLEPEAKGVMPIRTLIYEGAHIHARPILGDRRIVHIGKKKRLGFSIGTWEPVGRDAEEAFEEIMAHRDSHEPYFAANYDRANFHVNTWSKILKEKDTWGC